MSYRHNDNIQYTAVVHTILPGFLGGGNEGSLAMAFLNISPKPICKETSLFLNP